MMANKLIALVFLLQLGTLRRLSFSENAHAHFDQHVLIRSIDRFEKEFILI